MNNRFIALKQAVFILLLCFIFPFFAQAKEPPPKSSKLVNDYVNVMTASQKRQLENKLVAFGDTTSTQIAIVIEESTEGDDTFDYAFRLARAWGIGQDDKDNGVLIYVAVQDRKIRIITGYGVEATLTDARSKRIIENILKPAFRKGQYYVGLNNGTSKIIEFTNGEFTADDEETSGISPLILFILIVLLFFLFAYLASRGGNGGDGGYYRGGHYDDPRAGSGGGWWIGGTGGFSGGGGGGGFSGGGGFGGFGGGSFGGGGAGGSW